MKKRIAWLIALLVLGFALVTAACTTHTPDPLDTLPPDGSAPSPAVSDTPEPHESAEEPTGERETLPEEEPETQYDITQEEVPPVMAEGYFNVRDYGARGDGKTDDSAAIQEAALAAQNARGVLYFPEGEYLVAQTVTLPYDNALTLRMLGRRATVIGAESLNGAIFLIQMKYHFYMYDLNLIHNGNGSCVDALFLRAENCRFTGDAENPAPVVTFHGSDCRVAECSFDVNCPEAYALAYVKQRDEISINDYIIDNVFRGVGKGIVVGDGDYREDGRCEGLKINGNYFYNTGAEQIRVTEILHVNIAHNTMKGCTGSAIVLTQLGHGADGVFINDNRIESDGLACIASEEGEDNYISSVNINNNTLKGGQYGIYDPVIFIRAFIRENRFIGQSVAGAYTSGNTAQAVYGLYDNVFTEGEEVYSLQMNIRGNTLRLARNIVGEKNYVTGRGQEAFKNGCTVGGEKGDNLTRLDAITAPDSANKYEGEADIGDEEYREPETEPPMDVPIISDDPVEAPLWHEAGGYASEPLHIGGSVTLHFAATAPFDSISMVNPSWGDSKGSIHVELYAWDRNYDKSLDAEPLAVTDWVDFPDNTRNRLRLEAPLPAGQYLMVMSIDPAKVGEMVGFYTQKHNEACVRVYVDGSPREGLELAHTLIHYTQTPETPLWPASKDRP